MSDNSQKWLWMVDYCNDNGLPPAQTWAWDRAEKAFNEQTNNQTNNKQAMNKENENVNIDGLKSMGMVEGHDAAEYGEGLLINTRPITDEEMPLLLEHSNPMPSTGKQVLFFVSIAIIIVVAYSLIF